MNTGINHHGHYLEDEERENVLKLKTGKTKRLGENYIDRFTMIHKIYDT